MPLVLRETKGEKLTIAEVDGNFTYLNNGIEAGQDNLNSLASTVQPLIENKAVGYPLNFKLIKGYKSGEAGLAYTLIGEDSGYVLLTENEESTVSIIVPNELFKGDFVIKMIRTGTGTVELVGEQGVTINSKNGHLFISSQYGQAELLYYAKESQFFLIGDLSAS